METASVLIIVSVVFDEKLINAYFQRNFSFTLT